MAAPPRKKTPAKKRIPQRAVMPPPKHFWERQPEEPPRAWDGFCKYRDMGPQRSNRKVAKELGITPTQVDEWGIRYRWRERIALWQKHQDDLWAEARAEHLTAMAKRHAALAMKMSDVLWKRLKTLVPEELTVKELHQWAKVAVDMERVALGAPSANVNISSNQPIAIQNNVEVRMSQDERIKEIERLAKRREVCGYD